MIFRKDSPLNFLNKLFSSQASTQFGEIENMITLDLNKNPEMILDLTKAAPSLVNLRGDMSWQMRQVTGVDFDLDLFGIVLDANSKLNAATDVVYFKNKTHPSGCASVPVDNTDGSDVESIFFNLPKTPVDRPIIAIYVVIFQGNNNNRGQTFGMIGNAKFSLFDNDTGEHVADYNISQYVNDNVLHIGNLVRNEGSWNFEPEGLGANINSINDVVAAYC